MRPSSGEVADAPSGDSAAELVLGLARRLRLTRLARRYDRRLVVGAFAFLNALVSIAVMAAVAWGTGEAFVFPSLGPTAFLLFYRPLAAASSPRNTVCGHAIGILAGYAALAAFGLTSSGAATTTGVAPARIGAAALSLALTAGGMIWLSVPHPPAGATTLIVSLGILHTPSQLAILMAGVVLITAQGFAINRLAGLDYPWWRPRPPAGQNSGNTGTSP